jgi:hypothetical protein
VNRVFGKVCCDIVVVVVVVVVVVGGGGGGGKCDGNGEKSDDCCDVGFRDGKRSEGFVLS